MDCRGAGAGGNLNWIIWEGGGADAGCITNAFGDAETNT